MRKLGKLKNKILSVRNARTTSHMILLNELSQELKIQKDQLRAWGHPTTWDHYCSTQFYSETFSGINYKTIDIGKQLWEVV